MKLTDINEIKALLGRHGFRFSKSMGQNFLCADWVPVQIAESSGADERTAVLEVGPGIGCLTVQLAKRAGKVVSVELDNALRPVLAETLADCPNAEVVFGDVMKQDIPQLIAEHMPGYDSYMVCANLPYNITSPVLTKLVTSGIFDAVTVMIQREVAKRICAGENTADYGAFTILMQWYCETEMLFDVHPGCFIPAPKVTSSVIRLKKRREPLCPVQDEKLMFSIVRAAFNQRRKTLQNALSSGLGLDKAMITAALTAAGLDERVRGEALSIQDFAHLSDAISELKK